MTAPISTAGPVTAADAMPGRPTLVLDPVLTTAAAAAGLELLAQATWSAEDGEAPTLAGFVLSSFAPLVAAVAHRCLSSHYGAPPVPDPRGDRTAVVVCSASGDLGTTIALADAVDAGRRVPPLLFFQAVPNAVVGHVAGQWGLRGPVVCISPAGDPVAEAFDVVGLLRRDGDADEALVVLVEQADPRASTADQPGAPARGDRAGADRAPDEQAARDEQAAADRATALLVRGVHTGPTRQPRNEGARA
jgi:Beta-ketoacyl synthase, N-terminal domain